MLLLNCSLVEHLPMRNFLTLVELFFSIEIIYAKTVLTLLSQCPLVRSLTMRNYI